MQAARAKVVLDTNVFIHYLRAGLHADWVAGRVDGKLRFLSAVVLMELRLGADTPRRRRAVDRLADAFPPGRVLAPGPDLYQRAGVLFRRIHGRLRAAGPPRSDRRHPDRAHRLEHRRAGDHGERGGLRADQAAPARVRLVAARGGVRPSHLTLGRPLRAPTNPGEGWLTTYAGSLKLYA